VYEIVANFIKNKPWFIRLYSHIFPTGLNRTFCEGCHSNLMDIREEGNLVILINQSINSILRSVSQTLSYFSWLFANLKARLAIHPCCRLYCWNGTESSGWRRWVRWDGNGSNSISWLQANWMNWAVRWDPWLSIHNKAIFLSRTIFGEGMEMINPNDSQFHHLYSRFQLFGRYTGGVALPNSSC
jgi:hypothetical protein